MTQIAPVSVMVYLHRAEQPQSASFVSPGLICCLHHLLWTTPTTPPLLSNFPSQRNFNLGGCCNRYLKTLLWRQPRFARPGRVGVCQVTWSSINFNQLSNDLLGIALQYISTITILNLAHLAGPPTLGNFLHYTIILHKSEDGYKCIKEHLVRIIPA